MASKFSLEVVTPDEIFYKDDVEMVIFRTTEGDRAVLKNHIPFVSGLKKGELRIKLDGNFKEANILEGFVNVQKGKTVILTQSAEWK
ncbi:FoF1 ATP synthase subunit delta/epsilon [Metaclostridioides mangenotii]|uniref:FoF1 ATP synthase subunit delta/epsilon n=1 Tax=Metaclostridioides mangenotii TaxID=1540 RepID=UPI00046360B3|nr:F0F1 ATP synthase subunit epsilon [Clostridioides mangenotii]